MIIQIRMTLLTSSLVALLCGCEQSSPSMPSTQPTSNLTAADGNYSSQHPVTLEIYWYNDAKAVLTASGKKDNKQISVVAQWNVDRVASANLKAAISAGPLKNDVANVSVMSAGTLLEQAGEGTVSIGRADGRVKGVVDAGPLSLTLDGALSTSCWVPQQELSSSPPVTISAEIETESLVLDNDFVSPRCQPFKNW
jgi:hypothetical protein